MKIKIEIDPSIRDKLNKLSTLDWQAIHILQVKDMYNRAPSLTPYDTGALLGSRFVEGTNTFGYSIEYSAHVEYGHRTKNGGFVAGRYFLRQNAETQIPIYKKDVEDRIKVLL